MAAALATLPYVLSAILLVLVTAAFYARVATDVAGRAQGALWALAAPTTTINASIAHTGFLVAGLFAGGLPVLRSRPVVAGVLFGLLTFKPQLGLLLPVALVAGGHWRTIVSATATAIAMIALSLLLFGLEPWLAMPQQLNRVVADILVAGQVNFNMLVTVYGGLRQIGVGHGVALAAQAVVTLALAFAIFRLWRSEASHELKCAALLRCQPARDTLPLHLRYPDAPGHGNDILTRLLAWQGFIGRKLSACWPGPRPDAVRAPAFANWSCRDACGRLAGVATRCAGWSGGRLRPCLVGTADA